MELRAFSISDGLIMHVQWFCFFPNPPKQEVHLVYAIDFSVLRLLFFFSLNPHFQLLWVRGKDGAFQPAFWHCRITSHLFGSRLFTTDQRSNMFLTSGWSLIARHYPINMLIIASEARLKQWFDCKISSARPEDTEWMWFRLNFIKLSFCYLSHFICSQTLIHPESGTGD